MSERSKYTCGLIKTVLSFSISVDGPEITRQIWNLQGPQAPSNSEGALASSAWTFLHIFKDSCSSSCPYTTFQPMGRGKNREWWTLLSEGFQRESYLSLPIGQNIAPWPCPAASEAENCSIQYSLDGLSAAKMWRFYN